MRGRYSTNFYTGKLRPEVLPLTLLYTIFERQGIPTSLFTLNQNHLARRLKYAMQFGWLVQ